MEKSVESVKTTIDKILQVEGKQIVDYTQTGKDHCRNAGQQRSNGRSYNQKS
jgi:hypothetical protein